MKSYFQKNQIWLVPLLITLVMAIPMLIWLALDSSLADSETGRHLWSSLMYGRLWYDFVAGRAPLNDLLTSYYQYPPLTYQPGILFYLLLGSNDKVLPLSNLVWLFVANFSLYQISKLIWDKRTALMSVVIFTSMPFIILSANRFSHALPLAAWVALTFYLSWLFLTKPETRRALWLGVIMGMGMLITWTYLLALIPLVFWIVARLIRDKKVKTKLLVRLSIVTFILASAVSLPWYIANRVAIADKMLEAGYISGALLGNLTNLFNNYLLLPLLAFLVIALYLTFTNRKLRESNLVMTGLASAIYILVSLFSTSPSALAMIAPFLALIVASSSFVIKRIRLFAVVILLIFIVNQLSLSFNLTGDRDISLAGLKVLRTGPKPTSQLCDLGEVAGAIPYGASAQLIGEAGDEINDWTTAFYLEKAGRAWRGSESDANLSDYWILRLNQSLISRQTLFEYQERAWVVDNFDCVDRSIIIVMKNAERASTYLPTY